MEFFLFTDNFIESKALSDLVLQLQEIEMQYNVILHIVHVSGKPMVKSGIDGLSHSDTNEGIAAGHALLSYVNLHRTCLEYLPLLSHYFQSWWPKEELGMLNFFKLVDWFTHDKEASRHNFVWTPAPAIAEIAIKKLGTWFHKEPFGHVHIWIYPRLFTSLWQKQAGKACSHVI